jgi:hypothetical protein
MQQKYLLSEHARLDSFPLRFGFIPPKYIELREITVDIVSTQNQKPKEIASGNYHVFAKCFDIDNGVALCSGRFVLTKKKQHHLYQTIVTVFGANPNLAERGVSDLIRKLREENEIDTVFIIDCLHKPYEQGILKDELALFKFLITIGVKNQTANLNKIMEAIRIERDNALEKSIELEIKLDHIFSESIKSDQKRTDYKGEKIDTSAICTLADVQVISRKKYNGENVDCTHLFFEEDIPQRKMDSIFDKTGAITKYAESLIGKKVYTTVWKPDTFKPMEWFRNIFEVSV